MRAKRGKILTLACSNCRKRKSKCGGERPACSQCSKRGVEDDCIYDLASDGRRTSQAHLNKVLSKRLEHLETLYHRIRRGGEDCQLAIQEIQQARPPEPLPRWQESGDLLTLDEEGQVHYYGGTSNLPSLGQALYKSISSNSNGTANGGGRANVSAGFSANVAAAEVPPVLLNHLLELYFCWQHSYYKILDKDLFLRDMQTKGKFFSSFLLNSMLALASMFCDAPILRSDPSDPGTAGYMFFNQAKSEIDQELSKRSLTSIQGLLLLATREAGSGRNSVGWVYSGMAIRMALDLGLHLDCRGLSQVGYLSPDDHRVRNTTFWGCYLFDQGWSLYLGRQSVMHLADVTVDVPEYLEDEPPQQWIPVYSVPNPALSTTPVPAYPHNTLTAILRLSGLIEQVIATVYIPGKRDALDTSSKCQALIARLSLWEGSLPSTLQYSDTLRHPAVIMLHTLNCALKIFLYKRFPDLQEEMLASRDRIISLLARYRELYSLQMTTNLSVYISFTAAAACLEPVADQSSDDNLLQCIDFLKEIGRSWSSATAIYHGLEGKVASGYSNSLFDMDIFDGLYLA